MSKDISVIIPMYNSGNYIKKSIDSLFMDADTDSNCRIELVLVDDGSSDDGIEIVTSCYKDRIDSGQLKILEQANYGVSIARNNAIKKATGRYISFVDADDYILPGYFHIIMNAINQHNPDIIEFGCKQFYGNEFFGKDIYVHNNFGINKTKEVIGDIYSNSIFYPPLRVIKSDMIGSIKFPPRVKFCEDLIFFYAIYNKSNKLYNIKETLYAYRKNPQGATLNVKEDYIDCLKQFYHEIKNKNSPHYSFLKINLYYIVYKCYFNLGRNIEFPELPFITRCKLFADVLNNEYIGFRKKFILIFPQIYRRAVLVKKLLWK